MKTIDEVAYYSSTDFHGIKTARFLRKAALVVLRLALGLVLKVLGILAAGAIAVLIIRNVYGF
jgi:hypothetical protein